MVTVTGVDMNRDGTHDIRVHAPVDEPTAMSFTIPLTGSTTVPTAAVVTTYSASAYYTDSTTPTSRGCLHRDVVCWWKFHSRWCIRFSLGQREANDGFEEVLSKGVPPPGIGGVGFGSSPNSAMDHIIYELCLPSESDDA